MKFEWEPFIEKNEKLFDYNNSLLNFCKEKGLEVSSYDDNTEKQMANKFNVEFLSDRIKNGDNNKILDKPKILENFFKNKGYKIIEPSSIIKRDGSTLFTSAGVQILDEIIFKEEDILNEKMYVSQPVLRTQFIDNVKEGTSTSFINMSSEKINATLSEHFSSVGDWLSLLEDLGINKRDLNIYDRKGEPNWGGKAFKNHILTFFFKGLEIGDAIYAYDVPQDSRENLNFSDIGFGLERLRWSLGDNNYFGWNSEDNIRPKILDYCKTLTILSGSGLIPSNNNHGYRFRQFSKKLQSEYPGQKNKIKEILVYYYDFWREWTKFEKDKSDCISTIEKENERNFNRILLDRLSEKHSDVGIDINMPTEELLKRLKGTSVGKTYLENILKELYERY
ncbi:MAG: hypothetical protein WC458_03520 [Patescibacteria group bacterium]